MCEKFMSELVMKQEPMQAFLAQVNETKLGVTRQEAVDTIKKYPVSQDSLDRLFNKYVQYTSQKIVQVPKEKV
jgi:hypothetical protein